MIIATPPAAAIKMLFGEARARVSGWTKGMIPIKASCLEIALDGAIQPSHRFVLGLDRPLYYSLHSAYASLGRADGHVIHLMKYLPHGVAFDAKETEAMLETFLERVQPGWREHVRFRRFLPQMTVSHALVSPALATQAPRGPQVSGTEGLYVIGDWVGKGAMLVDASVASAAQAATQVVERTRALASAA